MKKARLRDVNAELACGICHGYVVDAVKVVECWHLFCRSCLLKKLLGETRQHRQRTILMLQGHTGATPPQVLCPARIRRQNKDEPCSTSIPLTHINKNVRPDRTIQTLVYKLVPGLFTEELQRRRDFLNEFGRKKKQSLGPHTGAIGQLNEEVNKLKTRLFDANLLDLRHIIAAPDQKFSICLQYYCDESMPSTSNDDKNDIQTPVIKRYFRCVGAVTIGHFRKLLLSKLELSPKFDIYMAALGNKDKLVALDNSFTIADVAYILQYDQKAPLQIQFIIGFAKGKPLSAPVYLNVEKQIETKPTLTPICSYTPKLSQYAMPQPMPPTKPMPNKPQPVQTKPINAPLLKGQLSQAPQLPPHFASTMLPAIMAQNHVNTAPAMLQSMNGDEPVRKKRKPISPTKLTNRTSFNSALTSPVTNNAVASSSTASQSTSSSSIFPTQSNSLFASSPLMRAQLSGSTDGRSGSFSSVGQSPQSLQQQSMLNSMWQNQMAYAAVQQMMQQFVTTAQPHEIAQALAAMMQPQQQMQQQWMAMQMQGCFRPPPDPYPRNK